jgi:hypothetical protein
MNSETYDARMEQWISEEYAALTPETLRQFNEVTIDERVENAVLERTRAEIERDPAFREYLCEWTARDVLTRYLEERRPTGSYREDGLFPISNDFWIQMPKATREHLLAWSALELDTANLRYIANRLAAWDLTKHQTLADLERDLAEGGRK